MTLELPEALVAAMDRLAQGRLLVALDFDGTLSPHVDDPDAARPLPDAWQAVLELHATPRVSLALVSGRALASLRHVANPPDDFYLVGSHGLEFHFGGTASDGTGIVLDAVDKTRRAALGRVLAEVSELHEAAWIEEKPAGFVLHTRGIPTLEATAIEDAARRAAGSAVGGLTMRPGKNVLEFSLRAGDKGSAITRLRAHTRADAVFYAGDDVTDEDAFAVLGASDVGLKVGPGETLAEFRVDGPADVASVLTALARRLSA